MRFILLTILSVLIFTPLAVSAGDRLAVACNEQNNLLGCVQEKSGYAPASDTSVSERVGQVINMVLSLVGTIFLVLMIYSGFLWMTAAGEEEKVTTAISIIKYAVTGLIIVLSAYSVTYFVLGALYKPSGETAPAGESSTNGCCEVCGVLGSNPVTGVLTGAYWLEEGGFGCGDRPTSDNTVCQSNCNGTVGKCTFSSSPCD